MDKNAISLGLQIGRLLAGQRWKRMPVAYLYNGVRLPPLPEWDKHVYPHAVISVASPNMLHKYYTGSLRLYSAIAAGDGGITCPVDAETGFLRYQITWNEGDAVPTDSWGEATEYAPGHTMGSVAFSIIKWANTDIAASDGSWSISASEPVLIYE